MRDNDNLETPEWVWRALGPIQLDPCAGLNTRIGKVNWCIDRGEDGLKKPWRGMWFCNPPFSQKEKWIEKAISSCGVGGILLLPERGSAPWFGPLAEKSNAYWVMGKRINFVGGPSSNNVGTVLFLFGGECVTRVGNSGLPGHLCLCLSYRSRDNSEVK